MDLFGDPGVRTTAGRSALGETDPVAAGVLDARAARHAFGVVGGDDFGCACG